MIRKFPKRSKHGNSKVVSYDGQKFDSKREYTRYIELCVLLSTGEITDLVRQKVYVLVPSVILDGRKKPAIRYVADFVYRGVIKDAVEDAKSPHLRKDPVYRMKKHLMKAVHGIDITEV